MQKNQFFHIEKLCKENKNNFWKKFNFLKNQKNASISIDIIDLKNHYQDTFSNSFEINLNK